MGLSFGKRSAFCVNFDHTHIFGAERGIIYDKQKYGSWRKKKTIF